ncbi:hypothetical protein [Prauserella alba]|uniref:Uncharacterized protein n=1 Tax=Prauserella alba TaxID=176898 RepID=A0ABN1VUK8_9PSEU|nr:hypothetical protein [Prauserella alba]MCP2183376.1 hypothetical protein [Prauserella alba]
MLMLSVTPPLALDGDTVWVFVSADTGAVDAARMAHVPGTETFAALPVEAFDPDSVLPTFRTTGEPVDGFRWATTADVDAHADMFTAGGDR